MDFLLSLFKGTGIATTILFISLTAFVGVLLGKITIKNVKLGVAGVLFSGLFFAHFGAKVDAHVLHFVREFGLILFVYSIGVEVGPRFVNSFRNDGLKLNMLALSVVLLGFITAFAIHMIGGVDPAVVTGIMSGAVTNTPGLGAAQQALIESGKPDDAAIAGMGYAVAYPFGVIGIILTMLLVRWIFRIKIDKEVNEYNAQITKNQQKLEGVEVAVTNPNLFGQKLSYLKNFVDKELVISRIERGGDFFIPTDDSTLEKGDVIYGVSAINHIDNLKIKIGEVTIGQKREISGSLAMFHVLVTNRKLAGKTIEQIGIYRRYEANITRIFRSGMEILPTLDTTVEFGDTVRVVGKRELLPEVRHELGNSVKELAHPNVIPLFMGIFLGVILGSIPIFLPGLPAPAKLGLAGGPLLIAILLGHKGRIGSLDFYMTPGANMMLKELGIILFLCCVGLSSGGQFVETLSKGGSAWLLYGALITFVPIFIVSLVARFMKLNYLKICGVISGAMTDPPALEYANSIAPVYAQASAYATVYPLTMFLRILLAQTLILLTL
ncbi:putative transporter [Xiashengella succiniciproducens]|jgi:putative transport protein|uniref:Transporter n=1 Tax=Xiashengella succiniciproducens TaxID=2949635 RepID=A0A9J6ZT23_9BACT|nr:putative transporter [Alkaliflexus sp. Ai-910]MDI9538425.1 putative transporter [Bacteroidota bacterium]URW80813.1 putative transporter [Alkaliflexus sp. Ai-910]